MSDYRNLPFKFGYALEVIGKGPVVDEPEIFPHRLRLPNSAEHLLAGLVTGFGETERLLRLRYERLAV